MHRYICPMSFTSAGSSSYYALVFGSVSNLSLLTICDYYKYSHDKKSERKNGDRAGICYGYWWV